MFQIAFSLLAAFAALGAAVMCGFFYGFSCVVMPAFARRPAGEAAQAMRSINVVVLNPLFFFLFFGTAVAGVAVAVGALAAVATLAEGTQEAFLASAAALAYAIGCVGVTIARNVPLNQALERSDPATAEWFWPRYLADWTWWNHVRTIACALSAAGFLLLFA